MSEFRFGDNWQTYVEEHLTEERLERAKSSLRDFYGLSDFEGLTFVDVGCGSGIFSYCAYQLGAERVVSFDVSEEVVEATKRMRAHADEPANWTVTQGNVLDVDFVESLGDFNLVYSWGVLHHTGAMFEAIENTLRLVAPDGRFYLAVANDGTKAGFSSATWARIKRTYNAAPRIGKRLLEAVHITGYVLYYLAHGTNPIKKMRTKSRGMAFYPDVKDWLGATPFEFATPDEVIGHVEDSDVGEFDVERLRTTDERPDTAGTGCNEYLFHRQR